MPEPNLREAGVAAVPGEPQFPFLDLRAQFAEIREEVLAAVTRVLESQQFILGPEVAKFEEEIRDTIGCGHAIGCASGSDALLLALMALQIGPGDEVIVPAFTFVATAGAVARLQATPVFVDIDPRTYNLEPQELEAAITPRTRAIIPVHLFGLPADMEAILEVSRRHRLAVIEDAAQAIGASYQGRPVGSLGLMGCFSFFPSKNLGAAGDGGLVTTNDATVADKLRLLRDHGSRRKYEYELAGTNSRLDAIQAAILRIKLHHLSRWTQGRQKNARRYQELLAEFRLLDLIQPPTVPAGSKHAYNQYTIRTRRRDALQRYLADHGIPSAVYYPSPLHLQPAFAGLGYQPGSLPESERACAEVLSLPIYPELPEKRLQTVVETMAGYFRSGL